MAINCRSRVPAPILSFSSSSLPLSSVLFTVLGEFEVCSLHFTAYTLHFNLCPWRHWLYLSLPSSSQSICSLGSISWFWVPFSMRFFGNFPLRKVKFVWSAQRVRCDFQNSWISCSFVRERERGNERKGVTIENETFCIIFKVWKELQILIEFIRNGHEIELHESQHAAVLFVSICILNMNI